MVAIEKCTCSFKGSKHVMEHTNDLPFKPFVQETKSWKHGSLGNLIDEEGAIVGAWILVV
jgi:hypothetical protein